MRAPVFVTAAIAGLLVSRAAIVAPKSASGLDLVEQPKRRSSQSDVLLLAPPGAPVGAEVAQVSVASSGDQALVVWSEPLSGTDNRQQVMAAFLSEGNAAKTGPAFRVLVTEDNVTPSEVAVWTGAYYAVLVPIEQQVLALARISADGAVLDVTPLPLESRANGVKATVSELGQLFVVAGDMGYLIEETSIARVVDLGGEWQCLVAIGERFYGARPEPQVGLAVLSVSAEGDVEARLVPSEPLPSEVACSRIADDLWVTWSDVSTTVARRHGPDLGPRSEAIELERKSYARARPLSLPAVDGNGALAWKDNSGVHLVDVSEDGSVDDTIREVIIPISTCSVQVVAVGPRWLSICGLDTYSGKRVRAQWYETGLVSEVPGAPGQWPWLVVRSDDQRHPRAAWNGERYLLVWGELVEARELTVRAALYDTAGVRTSEVVTLFEPFKASIEDLRIDPMAGGFRLVWAERYGGALQALFLTDAGVAWSTSIASDIEYGKSQLVTTPDHTYFLLFASSLHVFELPDEPRDALHRVSPVSVRSPRPSVAALADQVAVAWIEDSELRAARLNSSFQPIDFGPISLTDTHSRFADQVAIRPRSAGYQLIFEDGSSGSSGPVGALTLTEDGTPGEKLLLPDVGGPIGDSELWLAPLGEGFVAGWVTSELAVDVPVIARLRPDGSWLGPVDVSPGSSSAKWLSLTSGPDGHALVAYSAFDDSPAFRASRAAAVVVAPGFDKGVECFEDGDCDSGYCSDGVCCDRRCSDTPCHACARAAGASFDGVCGPVADGAVCEDGFCAAGVCEPAPPQQQPPRPFPNTPPVSEQVDYSLPSPASPPEPPTGGGCSVATGSAPAPVTPSWLVLLAGLLVWNRRRFSRFAVVGLAAALASLAGASGCQQSALTSCADVICPVGQVCNEEALVCARPEEISPCEGLASGEPCTLAGRQGVCTDGVCRDFRCGNGIVEPGEACDDGNREAADGCSPSCTSDETCGNGILDAVAGESCDCGDGTGPLPAGCPGPNDNDQPNGCRTDCSFASCGDGVVQKNLEDCEGDVDVTCEDLGFGPGTVSCTPGCRYDTSACQRCGNGVVDPGEVCDGAPPVTLQCADFGFDYGHVECSRACAVDTSPCQQLDWELVTQVGDDAINAIADWEGQAVAVGNAGTLFEYEPIADMWQPAIAVVTDDLLDVALSDSLALAVGRNGAVAVRRDGVWFAEASGVDADLHGLWLAPDGTAVAVGDASTVIKRGLDGVWSSLEPLPNDEIDLRVVAATPGGRLYVGGDPGLYEQRADGWSRMYLEGTPIKALEVRSATEMYVAAHGFYRFDGLNWSRVGDQGGLRYMDRAGDIGLLVGGGYRGDLFLYHYGEDQLVNFAAGRNTSDIWARDDGTVELVTGRGFERLGVSRWVELSANDELRSGSALWASQRGLYSLHEIGKLLRWDGRQWYDVVGRAIGNVRMRALVGYEDRPNLAVGDGGVIARRQGERWMFDAQGLSSANLHGAFSLDAHLAYAVGDAGTVLRFDGAEWHTVDVGAEAHLRDVWASAADDVWLAGQQGFLAHFDGSSWTRHHVTDVNLSALWGSGPDDVLVVGEAGTALHFDGTAWQATVTGVADDLADIHGVSATEVFANGKEAMVAWNGKRWSRIGTPIAQYSSYSDDDPVCVTDESVFTSTNQVLVRKRAW